LKRCSAAVLVTYGFAMLKMFDGKKARAYWAGWL
jgi:hypothetical protein